MQVEASSIRLVGAPRLGNRRKMSGLGIDFSEAAPPDSPLYHWEADLPNHPSFVYEGLVPRTSRWSESTQRSRSTRAASLGNDSILVSTGVSTSGRQPTRPDAESAYTSSIVIGKRPSIAEVQAWMDGKHDARSARASADSQASCGPITPQDELDDGHVRVRGIYNFGEAPRKAPLPPGVSTAGLPKASPDLTSKLQRRPSLTQSMMRTLGGRKKETRPPPPLQLAPTVPPVPTLPAKYEVAPILHVLDKPIDRRSDSKGRTGHAKRDSPALADVSPRPNSRPTSSSGRRASGASFGALFRTMKKSISRRPSKASPQLEPSGKMTIAKSPVFSVKSNAPSFVSIQVETYMDVRSTPSSPRPDRQDALQMIAPASRAGQTNSRPSTAPAGVSSKLGLKPQIPPYVRASSHAAEVSTPKSDYRAGTSGLDIQYRNPWRTTTAFEPASGYAETQALPPSPPSWLVSHHQLLNGREPASSETAASRKMDRLGVPREVTKKSGSLYSTSAGGSSFSIGSTSPTSLPSWTPMVALPSPDVSSIQTPSKTFLDLHPSPASASCTFDSTPISRHSREQVRTEAKAAYLLTPGQISMRDPWTRTKGVEKTAISDDSIQLSRQSSECSCYVASDSPSVARSPSLRTSPANRSRRGSRMAVPRIETEELSDITSEVENDFSQKLYTGCRPFRRPSVDEELAMTPVFKNPFITRSSLADIREAQVEQLTRAVPRSVSLAAQGSQASSTEECVITRPSFATVDSGYSCRRPSYASDRSNQAFPSKPTRFEFRRPTLTSSNGIRVSFDTGMSL